MTYCSPSVAKMKKSSPPPPSSPSSTKVTSRPPSVCGSIKRVTSGRHCKCCTEAIGRRYSGYKAQELIHLVLESKHSTRAEVLFTSTLLFFYRRFNFLYLTFFSPFTTFAPAQRIARRCRELDCRAAQESSPANRVQAYGEITAALSLRT